MGRGWTTWKSPRAVSFRRAFSEGKRSVSGGTGGRYVTGNSPIMKAPKISRQRLWQKVNLAAGRCKLCSQRRAPGDSTFCPGHRLAYREEHRLYMQKRRKTESPIVG